MRIGYPCINSTIGCTANHTFRLASYTEERLKETVSLNLDCLRAILRYNIENSLLFFRIGSAIVPFASHPVCRFAWNAFFKKEFKEIGSFIKKNNMRVSMHPDQFVLINAIKDDVVQRSVKELAYHTLVLDSMSLGQDAKIQIHVGGVYGDKPAAVKRFIDNYRTLPLSIRKRLVIENDDRLYSLKDCLDIHDKTGIPILLDTFHHECLNNGEDLRTAVRMASGTWGKKDGCLLIDYSEQEKNKHTGKHASHITIKKFGTILKQINGIDADIMLEIKDKEKSALKAIKLISIATSSS